MTQAWRCEPSAVAGGRLRPPACWPPRRRAFRPVPAQRLSDDPGRRRRGMPTQPEPPAGRVPCSGLAFEHLPRGSPASASRTRADRASQSELIRTAGTVGSTRPEQARNLRSAPFKAVALEAPSRDSATEREDDVRERRSARRRVGLPEATNASRRWRRPQAPARCCLQFRWFPNRTRRCGPENEFPVFFRISVHLTTKLLIFFKPRSSAQKVRVNQSDEAIAGCSKQL